MPRWKSINNKDSFCTSYKGREFLIEKTGRGVWTLSVDGIKFCTVHGKEDANSVINKEIYEHAGFCDILDGKRCTCTHSPTEVVTEIPPKKKLSSQVFVKKFRINK
jgi:hypothetical protein